MRITFSTLDGDVTDLDLPDDMSLLDVQPLLEEDLKLAASHMSFFHNGTLLPDKQKTLKQLGLKENEMVIVRAKNSQQQPSASSNGTTGAPAATATPFPQIDFSSVRIPSAARSAAAGSSRSTSRPQRQQHNNSQAVENIPDGQIRAIISQCKQNPNQLDQIRDRNPAMADAIQTENVAEVRRAMKEDQDRVRRLYENPLDPEAQRLIEDEIRRQNIQGNLETAIEHLPEVFATVTMLYIRCRVNDREVLAFVDSGAQSTIMSKACAERCGILRLMDVRFSGIAKGVGTQRILGRIHLAQLDVGGVFVPTSFTVLEDQPMDMLIGLDMLKRHQCVIDLARNVLVFGTAGKEAPFLPESELPAYAKIHLMGDDGEPTTPSGSNPSVSFEPSEETIAQLVQMGFDRNQAIQKLKKFFGDVNASASELLNERK